MSCIPKRPPNPGGLGAGGCKRGELGEGWCERVGLSEGGYERGGLSEGGCDRRGISWMVAFLFESNFFFENPYCFICKFRFIFVIKYWQIDHFACQGGFYVLNFFIGFGMSSHGKDWND